MHQWVRDKQPYSSDIEQDKHDDRAVGTASVELGLGLG
jgi:hypothetical protein